MKLVVIKLNTDPRKELIKTTHIHAKRLYKRQLKLLRRYRIGIWVRENYLARELERNKLVVFLARKLFKRTTEEGLKELLNISSVDIQYLEQKEKKLNSL